MDNWELKIMITCKVFFNANIGIYVENRPYVVLIYVNFRGGG